MVAGDEMPTCHSPGSPPAGLSPRHHRHHTASPRRAGGSAPPPRASVEGVVTVEGGRGVAQSTAQREAAQQQLSEAQARCMELEAERQALVRQHARSGPRAHHPAVSLARSRSTDTNQTTPPPRPFSSSSSSSSSSGLAAARGPGRRGGDAAALAGVEECLMAPLPPSQPARGRWILCLPPTSHMRAADSDSFGCV
jgi:hypothetical protein